MKRIFPITSFLIFPVLIWMLGLSYFHLSFQESFSLASWYFMLSFFGILSTLRFENLKTSSVNFASFNAYGIGRCLLVGCFFYGIWLLNHLHFFSFSGICLKIVFFLILILIGILLKHQKIRFHLNSYRAIFFYYELPSFILFVTYLVFFFHVPEFYIGEKAMDFNMLNYFSRFEHFPVQDPWASGNAMKYYYFGYYLFAGFGKLTSLSPLLSYPAALASLLVWFWGASFSIFMLLLRKVRLAFMVSLIFVFASNLNSLRKLFDPTQILDLMYMWGNTRVFAADSFAEFPIWSFLFRDLHSHVIAYPFNFCLLFYLFAYLNLRRFNPLVLALAYGMIFLISGWEFITYAVVLCSFLLVLIWKARKQLLRLAKQLIIFCIAFIGLFGPYLNQYLGGKGAVISWVKPEHVNSLLSHYYFFGAWWITLIFALVLCLVKRFKPKFSYYIPLIFLIIAILAFVENVTFMERYNTVFKFYNHLWAYIGIASLGLWWSVRASLKRHWLHLHSCLSLFFIIVVLSGTYLNLRAMLNFRPFGDRPTLKGNHYLATIDQEEYGLIKWINENVKGTPILVEAMGTSFDYSTARISTNTGLPSYMGWDQHVQFRGTSFEQVFQRKHHLEFIYNSLDAIKVYEFMKTVGVQYLVLGRVEQMLYVPIGLKKFLSFQDLFIPVYHQGNTTLYRLK